MNDDSTKDTSAANTGKPAPEQSNQTTQPRADEEIGDYADPNAIQVDGGDNSFIADVDEKKSVPGKKHDAG